MKYGSPVWKQKYNSPLYTELLGLQTMFRDIDIITITGFMDYKAFEKHVLYYRNRATEEGLK